MRRTFLKLSQNVFSMKIFFVRNMIQISNGYPFANSFAVSNFKDRNTDKPTNFSVIMISITNRFLI